MSTTDLFEEITRESSPAVAALHAARAARKSSTITRQIVAQHGEAGQMLAPELLAEVGTLTCNANILTLDIGTQTGWALGLRDGKVHGGSESFAARRNEGPGQRWLKFQAWLGERYRQAGELQAIYYELVLAHGPKDQPNTLAAHVYGGFEAFLQAFADRNRIPLVGVGVGTIKKSATGKGNAKKEQVIAAMRARGHRVIDDNHGDALALLEYARQQEA